MPLRLGFLNFARKAPAMKLLNPKITIQNTESEFFLVNIAHDFSEVQKIDLTMLVNRENTTLAEVQAAALERTIELLQLMLKSCKTG